MSSIIVWLIIVVIGATLSIVNKRVQKAKKHEIPSASATELEDMSDLIDLVSPEEQSSLYEAMLRAQMSVNEQSDESEQFEEGFAPESEGSFRRFYADAEREGELESRYSFAEQEGVSSISDAARRTAELTERHSSSTTFALFILPNGQRFNLQTAMYYDVILHRRTSGLFALRNFRKV